MQEDTKSQLSRRHFLRGSATVGAGLVIGFNLGCSSQPKGTGTTTTTTANPEGPAPGEIMPNAFLRIAPDGQITVIAKHIEFGQGSHTGLATILAEELDADWAMVRVEAAPSNPKLYNNLMFGPVQGTGGSSAIANSWEQLRKAGAQARAMLVMAAAAKWGVDAAEITVERGRVMHAGKGKSAMFGELAPAAGALAAPAEVKLKDPSKFTLIGKQDVARVDVKPKTNGQARFTMDVYMPDMLTALVARPSRFGSKVKSFDPSSAKAVSGVVEVVEVPGRGVAVVAKNYWAAKKGRDALKVEWDESGAEMRGTAELWADFRKKAKEPGKEARKEGDAPAAIDKAAKVIEAEFEFPYLAHATMEPLDCVIQLTQEGCSIWEGSQIQTIDHMTAATVLGIPPERVRLETLLAGGSFGRRATPDCDVTYEAASIVKAIGGKAPIKLIWTREDDIRGGRYRPMFYHKLRGGLDAKGNIVGWQHRLVGQSILRGTPFAPNVGEDDLEDSMVEGASTLPYAIPNLLVTGSQIQTGVPVLWWRSVGHTHTAFSTEVFLDQLARAAGRDPLEVRRELLKNHPRERAVLDLAAAKAGWGSDLPAGKARGIAVHKSFNSYVAQVAEISLGKDKMPKVERVVCAVDCGVAINPDNIRAQVEGGIGYGLGAALFNEITLEKGQVVQSNFDDYRPLRMQDMPKIEVHIVPSTEAPTGIGEPGVPPIAPAVANAYLKLTGRPIHRLPFWRSVG